MKTDPKKILVPYAESEHETLDDLFELIQVKPGQKTLDMGSGDGRMVIEMARRGADAHGIEIIEKYVRRSLWKIAQANLSGKAFIHRKDFWDEGLSSYDIITIYPMAIIIDELKKKLTREVKKGAIVVVNGFKIPGRKVWKEKGFTFVYKF